MVDAIRAIGPAFSLIDHAFSKFWVFDEVVLFEVLRRLHHDGPHEFIVFVLQKVAMVDIAWEFNDLILWYVEVGVAAIVICFCPSDSDLHELS